MKFPIILLGVGAFCALLSPARADQSIARIWNEEILAAIRIDLPHPPAHARNLFHWSVACYDAWAAYDPQAVGYIYHGKHSAANLAAARREAISYAAYRLLKERYALSRNAATTLVLLDQRMIILGYPINNTSTDTSTPAGVGNSVYNAVSAFCLNDGSRQQQIYGDFPLASGGYAYTNAPLKASQAGLDAMPANINRWQRLTLVTAFAQNGLPIESTQTYLGPHWRNVRPFALSRSTANGPWIDPGGPPLFGSASHAQFVDEVVSVIRYSGQLTPDDGATLDIGPGAWGNNPLGTNAGTGRAFNPSTGLPYAANVKKRGDFARVLAEFWADGPNSETPPGHWNTMANQHVSDYPGYQKRIGGSGPVVDDLEWDVKLYFSLNAALHDAACTAWTLKRHYDGWRPISCIRYLGNLGQSTDPGGPSYHAQGLPLVPGLIEVVTAGTAAPGERHQGLTVGKVAIKTWPGQPLDPFSEHSGVRWIHADAWVPFQASTFVTPAFPGYISGHSTFSRSAAEMLTSFTGSPFFPGGMATYDVPQNAFLRFEQGPSEDVQLQWATYYDAADQAGLSRLWGGIHPPIDDFSGRTAGSQVGKTAWALARKYFDGSILSDPVEVNLATVWPAAATLECQTRRAMYYKLQFSSNLSLPWTDDPAGWQRASDSRITFPLTPVGPKGFYRVLLAPNP